MSDRPPHYTDLNGTERDIIRAVATFQATNDRLPSGEAIGKQILEEYPENFSISQVYRVLSTLQNEGLIFKEESKTDRRSFNAGLTSAGMAVLRELKAQYLDLVSLSELQTSDCDPVDETVAFHTDGRESTKVTSMSATLPSTTTSISTSTTTSNSTCQSKSTDETSILTTKGTGGGVSDPQVRACWAHGAARDIRDFLIKLDEIESKSQIAAAVDVPPRIVEVAVKNQPEWFNEHKILVNGCDVEAYSITEFGLQAAKEDVWSEIG